MKRAAFRPYEGREPFIFISYAHKNSAEVIPILERLDAAGYRVWYDDGIAPGSEWPEYIAEHLNASSVVLAFVSQESIDSPNCRREVTYALSKRKPFLGVILKETQMSPGMELQLSAQQCVLRYNYRTEEEFLSKILESSVLQPCLRPAAPEAPEPELSAGQEASASFALPAVPAQAAVRAEKTAGEKAEAAGLSKAGKSAGRLKKILLWSAAGAAGLFVLGIIIAQLIQNKYKFQDTTDPAMTAQASSGSETVRNDTTAAPQTEPPAPGGTQEETLPPEETTAAPAETALKGELEKLMSVTVPSGNPALLHPAGFLYGDSASGLMGLRGYDGVLDTGFLYSSDYSYIFGMGKSYEGKYLVVTKDTGAPQKTAESLNRLGVMDSHGSVIVPEQYAHIIDANEYYAICIRVNEETTDQNEAVISWAARTFSPKANIVDQVRFTGEWELIALETGKPVPGFSGTKYSEYSNLKYSSSFCGRLIKVNSREYVLPDGSTLRPDAEVLEDGSYMVKEPAVGTLYASDGTPLFTFDPNEGTIEADYTMENYFLRRKRADGYGYTLLDKDGQPVSAEFVTENISMPKVCGPFIILPTGESEAAGRVYHRDGREVTPLNVKLYDAVFDELHRVLKLETEDDEKTMFVSEDGTILFEIPDNGGFTDGFRVMDAEYRYYNFTAGTYALEGESAGDGWWIACLNAGGKYDLIDTFTGETLLKGYDDYEVTVSPEYGTIVGATYNQTTDVFVLR